MYIRMYVEFSVTSTFVCTVYICMYGMHMYVRYTYVCTVYICMYGIHAYVLYIRTHSM